jgi:hypothetical protein
LVPFFVKKFFSVAFFGFTYTLSVAIMDENSKQSIKTLICFFIDRVDGNFLKKK